MEYTLEQKIEAVKKLVNIYHTERIVFFTTSAISLLSIVSIATYCIITKNFTWDVLLALFFPAGLISMSSATLLRMHTSSLEFLKEELE